MTKWFQLLTCCIGEKFLGATVAAWGKLSPAGYFSHLYDS